MRVKFPSLRHSDKYGYAFDTESWRGGGEIECHFVMFETYGDGLTQHSHEHGILRDFFADYLGSLGFAMLENPEMIDRVSWMLQRRPSVDEIEFCASVKWKESDDQWDKRRYYSLELKKIGTAAKEHDKRYKQIEKSEDGSPEAIYRMLRSEHSDGLADYLYADAVRTWVLEQTKMYMELPGNFLKWWTENDRSREVMHALTACVDIIVSYQKRATAVSMLDGIKRNIERVREQEADVAAAAADAEKRRQECKTCTGLEVGDSECSYCARLVAIPAGTPVMDLATGKIVGDRVGDLAMAEVA